MIGNLTTKLIFSVCSFALVRSNSLWNSKKKHALDCTGPCVKFSLLKSKINEEEKLPIVGKYRFNIPTMATKENADKKILKAKMSFALIYCHQLIHSFFFTQY